MYKATAIVPTLKNISFLNFCIQSLKKQTVQVEIVIVNNCSDAATKALEDSHIKVVNTEGNLGFSKAVNYGLQFASGEFILVVNDDCYLPPKTVERLIHCYFNSKARPVGAVGPVSNYVAGEQQIREGVVTFQGSDDFAEEVFKKKKGNWTLTGFLSGFCLLLRRSDFGGFDERYFAGFEDNDLCMKLMLEGKKLIIAHDTFVWHFGHKVIERFPELRHGLSQWQTFFDKWTEVLTPKKRLAVVYRVKIVDDDNFKYFQRSLESVKNFADGILILDDNSPVDFRKFVSKHFGAQVRRYERNLMESRDRQELADWALAEGFDWILSLDHDEVFESRAGYVIKEKLLNPVDPSIFGYNFSFYTFWREGLVRTDGIFGAANGIRLVRLTPSPQVAKGTERGFHCGNIPVVPAYNCRHSSLRIMHFGYLKPEDRKRKFEFYTKNDPDPNPLLVGRKDYFHLIDENVSVVPWRELNRISLAMVVKNEGKVIWEFLRWIYPFFDEICIADTGSNDDTTKCCEKFGCRVFQFKFNNFNFSEARNFVKDKCSSEWILHLDPDEQLNDLQRVRRLTEIQSVDGYMFSVRNLRSDKSFSVSESIRLFRNDKRWYYTGVVHETMDESWKKNNMRVVSSPVPIDHFGYLKPKEELKKKLKNYFFLCHEQLRKFPEDERPYFNLGLHYLDCGKTSIAKNLFEVALTKNSDFLQPRMELIQVLLMELLSHLSVLLSRLPKSNPSYQFFQKMLETLRTVYHEPEKVYPTLLEEIGDPFNEIS